jgi:DNA-binding ferritin-like protein
MNKEQITNDLLTFQYQARYIHWQIPKSYATHVTFGNIFDNINVMMDEFAETMYGKYGRPKFEADFSLSFKDLSSISTSQFVNDFIAYLTNLQSQFDSVKDADMLNLIANMMIELNHRKYFLTFL